MTDPRVVEVGRLMLHAEVIRRRILRWMNERGNQGHQVTMAQAPDYVEFERRQLAADAAITAIDSADIQMIFDAGADK